MESNFKSLVIKFKEINKKGYIKGINNNLINSAGLTLENLLNKKADSLFFPDYKDIEIKCTQRFSRYPISLFSLSFDGPELFESNYLLENYGKYDNLIKSKKILITKLKYKEKILVYNKYHFELDIDYTKKKLYINIYDLNNNFIESRGFIDFDSLEKRTNIKLKKLALIFASKKIINNNLWFRYYKINCYKFKNFNTFLDLIKTNDIEITLMLRIGRSGKNLGKNKSKNILFMINKNNISKLFNKIYSYEK